MSVKSRSIELVKKKSYFLYCVSIKQLYSLLSKIGEQSRIAWVHVSWLDF